MDMMKEKCKTYNIEVLTKHPVVDVEVKNGRIVAVIAKSEKAISTSPAGPASCQSAAG
jgi:hypothetical protein